MHFYEVFCVQYRLEGNSTNYKLTLKYTFRAHDNKPTKCTDLFLKCLYYNIILNIPTYLETRGDSKPDVSTQEMSFCVLLVWCSEI